MLMEDHGVDEATAFEMAAKEFKELRKGLEIERKLARQQFEVLLPSKEIQHTTPLYKLLEGENEVLQLLHIKK